MCVINTSPRWFRQSWGNRTLSSSFHHILSSRALSAAWSPRPCVSGPGVCSPSTRMFACMFCLRPLKWAERVRLSPLVSSAPQLPRCLRWHRNVFIEKLKLKAFMFLARLLSGRQDKEKHWMHLHGYPKAPPP